LQRCRRSTLDDLVLEDLRALRLKMYSWSGTGNCC
jgi:hypothetical protein